jgi:CO/xanthine dehydrogenase Mo-binding subunit
VQHVQGAGCYGHNGADDVAFDAAWFARRSPGKPVRVLWSRADEFTRAPVGPAMVIEMEADLDEHGQLMHWRHQVWSTGHSQRPGRATTPALLGSWQTERGFEPTPAINMPLSVGGGAERNAVPGYDFAAFEVLGHHVSAPLPRSSALRSLGAYGNVFAAESFVDEIALAVGEEPLAWRLRHLGHDPRARAVLGLATDHAGWSTRARAEGVGLGLAVARYKGTGAWCAVVAEVEAGAQLRVRRLTIAVDVGQAINPDGVRAQIEGGAIQATSWALKEGVRFNAEGITSDTWERYPILRFSEVPAVDVHIVPSSAPSLGAGEASLGPSAAAIANAVFDALRVRVRELPLTPERIVAAMDDGSA